jgi:hypothetical protein
MWYWCVTGVSYQAWQRWTTKLHKGEYVKKNVFEGYFALAIPCTDPLLPNKKAWLTSIHYRMWQSKTDKLHQIKINFFALSYKFSRS